ncbi:MAG: putative sulfate exporter family transporter, partial [Actinomycetota bacterium]|nr:putative sulfate exporter family transporter [Actinomycetota bacterium]
PVVGASVTGVVLGVAVAAKRKPGPALAPGIAFAAKTVLQVSVVVLGFQLSIPQVLQVGASSLPVLLGTLAMCLAGAYWIGRWLGIVGDLRTLIGTGTGICGASAIAAVTPVIGAAEVEVSYAISTIFVFNIAAVLLFPLIGHALGLGQRSFGLFAGTAVNDMSSVVATATTYGSVAANHAIVVKLTRTLLIIPICLGLAALRQRAAPSRERSRSRVRVGRLVPLFLMGFVVAAAVNSTGLIPHAAHHSFGLVGAFLITVALSAIGLSTDFAGLRRTGPRPLILGALLWVLVSVTSLGLQWATGGFGG